MSRYYSQSREAIGRDTVTSLAMEQGFNVFLPVYDGSYSSAKPSKAEIAKWAAYRLPQIANVMTDAASAVVE